MIVIVCFFQTIQKVLNPFLAKSLVIFFWCASFYNKKLKTNLTVPPPISINLASLHNLSTIPSPQ